jgi:hypothetical protein
LLNLRFLHSLVLLLKFVLLLFRGVTQAAYSSHIYLIASL